MTTGDYLPDTPALLAGAHGHVCRLRLDGEDQALDAELGDRVVVTFDESRSPRAAVDVTLAQRAGLALDPRAGARVEVDAGYRRLDGSEDVHALVDLGVRSSRPRWDVDELQLQGAGDEARAIDASPAVVESVTAATSALGVTALLARCLNPAPTLTTTINGPAVTVDKIEDRWQALVDLADRAGAQLYDDGLRRWRFDPVPQLLAGEPDLAVTVGAGGTILVAEEGVERDTWHNYVMLVYRWRNAAGSDQQIVATAYVSTGDLGIYGPAGRRIFRDDRNVATTQAEANGAAASVLARLFSRGKTLTFRAVAAYWLRPGMTVDVTLPDGSTRRRLVASVRFDTLAGVMDVSTRLPVDLDVQTTTPPPDPATPTTPKPPVADPTPPATLRYVTEWPASSTAVYREDGTKRTDTDAGYVWQGEFDGSYNGNQRSLALFTGANSVPAPGYRGETGKTITQALAGLPSRSQLEKAELIATLDHAWFGEATVLLGYVDLTTAPATAPTVKATKAQPDWAERSTRRVSIMTTNMQRDLFDGSSRAVGFGVAPANDERYYCSLHDVRLRLTYSK